MKKLMQRLKNLFKFTPIDKDIPVTARNLLQAEIYRSGPTYAFARTTSGLNVFLPGNTMVVDEILTWQDVRPRRKVALRIKPDAHGRGWIATLILFLDDDATVAA